MELPCTSFRVTGPLLVVRGKSQILSPVVAGIWGIFSSYGRDGNSKLMFVQRSQDSCLITRDTSGISTRHCRATRTPLDVIRETEGPFLFARVILVFLSVFNKCHTSSPFEALNSPCLSRCKRDVRPPVQMMWEPRAFSRISRGSSDIPSSCAMKDEATFKPLQTNPSVFRVTASLCPFHLRQQIQGPSQIPIIEGSLLLRCLWEVVIPLQSNQVNQLSSLDDFRCTELP